LESIYSDDNNPIQAKEAWEYFKGISWRYNSRCYKSCERCAVET